MGGDDDHILSYFLSLSLSLELRCSDGLGLIQSHVRERVMPSLIICESSERASAQEEREREGRNRKNHGEPYNSAGSSSLRFFPFSLSGLLGSTNMNDAAAHHRSLGFALHLSCAFNERERIRLQYPGDVVAVVLCQCHRKTMRPGPGLFTLFHHTPSPIQTTARR